MKTFSRAIAVVFAANCSIFVIACKGMPEEAPYELQLTNHLAPTEVTVFLNGAELFASGDYVTVHEFEGRSYMEENPGGPGSFSLMVKAPWGWEELEESVAPPDPIVHELNAKAGRPTPLFAMVFAEEFLTGRQVGRLYIDNRDHEAVTVEIGQANFSFPADTFSGSSFLGDQGQGMVFPLPRDAGNAEVRLNGRPVGSVSIVQDTEELAPNPVYFIDTSGKRSYLLRHLEYGGIPVSFGPTRRTLRDKSFYQIADQPPARFFFVREAPARLFLTSEESARGVRALELTELPGR